MVAETSKPRSVTLTRVFDAPPELVFQAWTDAAHVVQWMKCDVSATLEVENWVAEVGNVFRTHMAQAGVFDVRGSGRFTAVDPPWLLEYVLDADPGLGVPAMTVRVVFEAVDARTRVTLTQSGLPSDFIEGVITAGWTASMEQLAAVVAARTSDEARPTDAPRSDDEARTTDDLRQADAGDRKLR